MAKTDIVFGVSMETVKLGADTAKARAAIEGVKKASEGLDGALKKAEKTNTNFSFAAARMSQQMDKLRMTYDPVFAATTRYEAAVAKVEKAHAKNAITTEQYQAMLDGLANKYQRASVAADGMAGGMGRATAMTGQMRGQIQNVGFQIQDFAVQVGAGTSATQAFAQQFPQLAGAFGPIGVAVGTLAAVTIPLLATAFSDAREKARTVETAMSDLKDMAEGLKATQDILGLSVYELRDRYGKYADEVQRSARELLNLQIVQAQNKLTESISDASDEIERFGNAVATIDATPIEDIDLITQMMADDFGLSADQVYALGTSLNAVQEASNFEERAKSLEAFNATMARVGVTTNDLPPALVNVLVQLQEIVQSTAALNAELDRAAATQAGMTTGVGLRVGDSNLIPPNTIPDPGNKPGGGGGGGGGRADPMQARIEALVESLRTQDEIVAAWYATSLEALNAASASELAAIGGKHEAIERLEEEHQARLAGIRDAGNQWGVLAALDGGAQILGAMASTNERAQKLQTTFAAASALISTWQGAAKELEKGTLGFASAAAVIAKGLGFVAAIKGSGGGGGRGGGGASAPASAQQQSGGQYLNFQFNGGWSSTEDMGRFMVKAINQAVENGAQIRGARIV